MSPLPTKLLMSWEDIGTDHPDVPAKILLSGHGTWLTQEQPRNQFQLFFNHFEVTSMPVRFSQSIKLGAIWFC